MKCLFEMKKKELLHEAIRMRQALIRIATEDFDFTDVTVDSRYPYLVGRIVSTAQFALDPESYLYSHLDHIYGLEESE